MRGPLLRVMTSSEEVREQRNTDFLSLHRKPQTVNHQDDLWMSVLAAKDQMEKVIV